ncbi:MAG: hypothetical protein H7Y38_13910, partial [Armatimonadetes bacterium]|nr:hypothetical protein [Armatimonadota bacterium]
MFLASVLVGVFRVGIRREQITVDAKVGIRGIAEIGSSPLNNAVFATKPLRVDTPPASDYDEVPDPPRAYYADCHCWLPGRHLWVSGQSVVTYVKIPVAAQTYDPVDKEVTVHVGAKSF